MGWKSSTNLVAVTREKDNGHVKALLESHRIHALRESCDHEETGHGNHRKTM